MIFKPKVGHEVQIRYGEKWRPLAKKYHGFFGRILKVGLGPKQQNCLVGISVLRWHPGAPDIQEVIPKGHLFAVTKD